MKGMQAAARLVEAFEDANIPYMIVGALSSSFYGIARSTYDADIVVAAPIPDVQRVVTSLGDDFRIEAQLSFESLTGTTRRLIRIRETSFVIELFQLSQDRFDLQRFKRRTQILLPALGRPVFVPTAEDVIIMKLQWGRSKDIEDVRGVIAVQSDSLDWDYIHEWVTQHGTLTLMNEVRHSLPPSA